MKQFIKKHQRLLRNFLFALSFLIALISLFQIWYVGSFLDNIIFDFFFGAGRYLIYLISFAIGFALFFKKNRLYATLTARRTLIVYTVLLNIILMVLSLIYYYRHLSGSVLNTNQYFANYFANNWISVKARSLLWQMNPEQLCHPGFFWLLFLVITRKNPIIFLWIICLTSSLFLLIYISYKVHLKLATDIVTLGEKIKRYFYNKNHNQVKNVIQETETTKQTSTSEILKNISKTEIIPFSLSSDAAEQYFNYFINNFTDVEEDRSAINKQYADRWINAISEFFEKNHIGSAFLESEVGPSALRILFSIPRERQIQWVTSKSTRNKLLDLLKIKSCFIYANKDRLRIELPLAEKGKISFKQTVSKLVHTSHMSALVGVDGHFDPIELTFNDSPITLINGDRQSGKENLLMQLVLSLLVRYSPNELIMAIIDNKNSLISRLDRVRNTVECVANDIASGIELMEKTIFEMKYRVKLLEDFQQSSIDKYNEKAVKKIANLLVIIHDINDFIAADAKYTFHFLKIIQKYSQKLNVFCLISTNLITETLATENAKKIYRNVISLQTRTPEESNMLVNKTILYELFGDGDFYYIKGVDGSEKPKICRGQTTYLNNDIINQIIKRVNNFNSTSSF